jgi:hypothetical protein
MKTILILILSSLLLLSCEKKASEEQHRVYFEHYAINYAWGFSYVHWVIDDEGNVRTLHKKDSDIQLNSNNINSATTVFDSIIYKIDKNELEQYVALILPAAKGVIDSTAQSRADFGTLVFNCFWYKEMTPTYSTILLSQMSDNLDKINVDSNAVKIVNWLKGIHSKIYSNL